MTEFWIQENDKYMLNDLCNIINDNVKTFTRSEPVQQPVFFQKKESSSITIHLAGMSFIIPARMFVGNLVYLTAMIKNAKKISHSRTLHALQDILEQSYKLAYCDQDLTVAAAAYENMEPQRRKKKNGKELKNYLNKRKTAAVKVCIDTNNIKQLQCLLDVCDFSYTLLATIIKNYGSLASAEALDCINSEMRKSAEF